MVKAFLAALPLIVLYGYMLAIIYQQWWLRQFNVPSDFVFLNANTLLIAAIISTIMLFILGICYFAISPLFIKNKVFNKVVDSSNAVQASLIALTLLLYSVYGIVSFYNFGGSTNLFSWAVISGVGALMIWITNLIAVWGFRSRLWPKKWYSKPYIYFEKHLIAPILISATLILIGSYLIAGQLSIMNWQAYVKEPNFVMVDGNEKLILVGIFGDKAGVVQPSEFGIDSTTRFVDIERITFINDLNN